MASRICASPASLLLMLLLLLRQGWVTAEAACCLNSCWLVLLGAGHWDAAGLEPQRAEQDTLQPTPSLLVLGIHDQVIMTGYISAVVVPFSRQFASHASSAVEQSTVDND